LSGDGVGGWGLFLRWVATDSLGEEAWIVCDWSDDLLKNLLAACKDAKGAQFTEVTMFS
jgi:hypothetical protein